MHWVLQKNLWNEEQYDTLVSLLDRLNIPYSIHKVIPFIGELLPDISPEGKVFVFGSYSMRHVARRKGWKPGCYDLDDVEFEVQRDHWSEDMLNYDAVITTFAEVEPPDEDFFIRPASDAKIFTGTIINKAEFLVWRKLAITNADKDDDLAVFAGSKVIISSPKPIQQEYRFWVVDKKIVTYSTYRIGHRIAYRADVDDDAIAFATGIASRSWQPREAYVLDIAKVEGGHKIVEINTINSAGLYAANIPKLVEALENLNNS